VKKDDVGIKHLKGLSKSEIQTAFSSCLPEVMNEVEGVIAASPPIKKLEKGVYIGMSIRGLPRFITSDNTINDVEKLVFRDVPVRRLVVLDNIDPAGLKVYFEKVITSTMIPHLVYNLKSFLKARNVDHKVVDDVTIRFLEEEVLKPAVSTSTNRPRSSNGPGHRRRRTNEFLVAPGDAADMTRLFIIEGIPVKYLLEDIFIQNISQKVFEGIPVDEIILPPDLNQMDKSVTRTKLEIHTKKPQNIRKLLKIAIKLKKFLKRKEIPAHIVNQVTLQVNHEDGKSKVSKLDKNPVVGLIFNRIPRKILESNESLYNMERVVFSREQPVRLIEANESEGTLKITLEKPIHDQQELLAIAQRLMRFLADSEVSQEAINNVKVMSFSRDKWEQTNQQDTVATFNQSSYVGIEVKNITSILDSGKKLEDFRWGAFSKQDVVSMKVVGPTLRLKLGKPMVSKAIEGMARDIKEYLSQRKIPNEQILNIIIEPHTQVSWERLQ